MGFRLEMQGVTVRVKTQSPLPRLFGHDGLTIGSRIYLRKPHTATSAHILAHEFRHVLQWRKYGFFGFLWRYLTLGLTRGYTNHPMEVEAEVYADDYAHIFQQYANLIQGVVAMPTSHRV